MDLQVLIARNCIVTFLQRKIILVKANRVLVENIFSMLTLRGLEYILSFLLVPYMLRTLGPTNYGAIAFMQSVVAYFNLFIDFGFPNCNNKLNTRRTFMQ
uniref:oligosaccharide flippase family protein n=1 Tax=Dialister massiliensis TaxID=2161821 RepID=UPI0022B26438|nr:oligosaccharide flippase family protein [Dialister massiliensis]